MIRLREIDKSFKNIDLFVNVNYVFEDGNIYLIKGPNGSGKSVLLKLICGFSIPDKGEIEIDNYILHKDVDFICNCGASINNDEFIPYLSGFDNLKLLLDINKKVQTDSIYKIAGIFHMEKDINKLYRKYSQGMKQKLRIMQALIEYPDILILDEPTNALDRTSIHILKQQLAMFLEDKSHLVIMTSHSDDEVSQSANKILEIDQLKLVEIA